MLLHESYLIFRIILGRKYHCHLHFTNEETETDFDLSIYHSLYMIVYRLKPIFVLLFLVLLNLTVAPVPLSLNQ